MIICVCNEAEKAVCDKCLKGHRIKPDLKMNAESWPRQPLQLKNEEDHATD